MRVLSPALNHFPVALGGDIFLSVPNGSKRLFWRKVSRIGKSDVTSLLFDAEGVLLGEQSSEQSSPPTIALMTPVLLKGTLSVTYVRIQTSLWHDGLSQATQSRGPMCGRGWREKKGRQRSLVRRAQGATSYFSRN